MKTGKLSEIPGYVDYMESQHGKQLTADYNQTKAFLATNFVLMAPVVLIGFLIFRWALRHLHGMARWLAGGAVIGCGAFGLFVVWILTMIGFYSGGPLPFSRSDWTDEYDRGMTFLVAGKLTGHPPADAFYSQLDDWDQILANKEIFLYTHVRGNYYVMVPAETIQGVRKIAEEEILNYHRSPEVLSLIPGRPDEGRPYHEQGHLNMGPYEITLNTPVPHAIWIIRCNYPKETVNNENFVLGLMKALPWGR